MGGGGGEGRVATRRARRASPPPGIEPGTTARRRRPLARRGVFVVRRRAGTVPRAPARVRGAGRRGEDPSMSAVPAGRVLRVRRRHAGAEGRLGLPAARVSRVRPCGRGRRARARKRERGGRGSRVDDAASMRDVSKGVLRRVQRRGGFSRRSTRTRRDGKREGSTCRRRRTSTCDASCASRRRRRRERSARRRRRWRDGEAGSERRAKSASDSLAERMQGWGSPVGTGIYQVPVWA